MSENMNEKAMLNEEELNMVTGGIGEFKHYVVHTVVKGDALARIAKHYGSTVDAIMKANAGKIKNPNHIEIGWLLIIPVK